jgi:hypothetical protein
MPAMAPADKDGLGEGVDGELVVGVGVGVGDVILGTELEVAVDVANEEVSVDVADVEVIAPT